MSKKSNNKKFHTLVGLFLVAVILLSGTYAWQSFNQGAFNPLHHHTNPGGRIHNYFEVSEVGIARWNDPTRGEGTFDLSILGENFGEREIQLRVRLHEFLLLDGGEDGYGIGGADINDVTTWPIFTIDGNFDATGGFDRADGLIEGAVAIGQEGNIEWFLGDFGDNGGLTYFMPTHNRITEDLSLPEHAANWATLLANTSVRDYFIDQDLYRFTNTTGRAFDALAGGQLLTGTIAPDVTHAADFYNEGYGVVTGDPTATGEFDEFAGAEFADYLIYFDHNDELQVSATPVTHYGQLTETPELNGVMTYEQWVNDYDRAFGNFWILDTETGWFYWRGQDVNGLGVLEVGTDGLTNATSLLLNQISINPTALAWQYIIHVDADLWFPGEAPIDANESILAVQETFTLEVRQAETAVFRGTETVIANPRLRSSVSGFVTSGFTATIVEADSTSSVDISSPLTLTVAANEPNDVLTIEITHPDVDEAVIITVDINNREHQIVFNPFNPLVALPGDTFLPALPNVSAVVQYRNDAGLWVTATTEWEITIANDGLAGVIILPDGRVSIAADATLGNRYVTATATSPMMEPLEIEIPLVQITDSAVIYRLAGGMDINFSPMMVNSTSSGSGALVLNRIEVVGGTQTVTNVISTVDANIEWSLNPPVPGITINPAANNRSVTLTVDAGVAPGINVTTLVATVPTPTGVQTLERYVTLIAEQPRDTFTDETGIEWIILVDYNDPFGGIGNALYITRDVFGWGTNHAPDGMTQANARRWNQVNQFTLMG